MKLLVLTPEQVKLLLFILQDSYDNDLATEELAKLIEVITTQASRS